MTSTKLGPYITFGALAGLFWFSVIQHQRVPVLSWWDLGVHEAGHLFSYLFPTPQWIQAAAGSAAQIAIPFAFGLYFLTVNSNLWAYLLCVGWTGANIVDVSLYVADADTQSLPLVGGDATYHDWGYLLGPQQLNMTHHANLFGTILWFLGGLLIVTAAATVVIRSVTYRET